MRRTGERFKVPPAPGRAAPEAGRSTPTKIKPQDGGFGDGAAGLVVAGLVVAGLLAGPLLGAVCVAGASPAFLLSNSLTSAGGSNAAGSTLLNSTSVKVIPTCMPACSMFILVKRCNFSIGFHSAKEIVLVICWPIGPSCVISMPCINLLSLL